MKRALVILHPGSLGDVLLAVPAIRRLAVRFPQHERLLIARASVSRLLSECRIVDEWMALERQDCTRLFAGSALVTGELQSWLTRCDVAVAWTEDKDGALGSALQKMGVALVQTQSPFSPVLRARHQGNRFLETLGETEADSSSERTVQVPSHLLERGKDYLEARRISRDQSLVLLHPGSGSIHKCLDPRRMALLVEELWRGGMCPLVLEGPDDQEAVDHVLQFVSQAPVLLRDLDLSQLAGVLAQVTLYIGHDSGVTHLSAFLGVRTIALFGPTDAQRWAPHGSHVTILRGSPCHCELWDTSRKCAEKPCLQVPIEAVLRASGVAIEAEQCKPS